MRCLRQIKVISILVCASFIVIFALVISFLVQNNLHNNTCRQDYYKCGGAYECEKYNCTQCVNPIYIPEYVCANYEDTYDTKLAAIILLAIILFGLLTYATLPVIKVLDEFISFMRRICCQRYRQVPLEM